MFKNLLGDSFDATNFVFTSLMIFFTFFCGVLIWTVFLSKKYTDKMKNLPLEDDQN